MVAASQKLLSLVGVANLATRAASSRPYRCGGNWGRKRAVRQTMPLPTLYRYVSSLTRPIRYMVETGGENPKAHVECDIPCCLARWPCTSESPLPIEPAGIHPGFLVRHPFKSPFTPISQIAEGQLFEIWEYYLIFRRGWVGGWLLSGYDSRRLVYLPTCTLKKCPGKTRALRAKV